MDIEVVSGGAAGSVGVEAPIEAYGTLSSPGKVDSDWCVVPP